MKALIPYGLASTMKKPLLAFAFIISSLYLSANSPSIPLESNTLISNIVGNIWVETDGNMTDNGEPGPSNVLVLLFDNEEDTIIAQSLSVVGKYEFNGIPPGKYYIQIDDSAFDIGGPLFNTQSCPGVNDADDMVDNDDNGTDTAPGVVFCSPFNLSNEDPNNAVSIEYIDFCFNIICDEANPYVVNSCSEIFSADILCDISGFDNLCATMPLDSSAGIQPSPLCDGISESENITWFAFVASDGDYTISINPFDCPFGTLGQQGIQVGLYTDCSFEESVFCSDCTEDPITINSTLLIPGQVYYVYINGCNGNVCSYLIDVSGNPMTPSLEPQDVCVFSNNAYQCEDLSYCPNSDIIIQGRGTNIAADFSWKITTISGTPYAGDASPITGSNELILNFPDEGTYEICLTEVDNGCTDQYWTGSVCRNITIDAGIIMPMDEDFGETFVCLGDEDDFSILVFANEDPNGDGTLGWQAPIFDFPLGLNQGTVSIEGCSYQQQFTLSTHDPSPIDDVLIVVCEDDLPIDIDNFTLTKFSFGGQKTFVVDSLLLQNSVDQNGCDSLVNLTVEKLNVLQGLILEPICTVDGINLAFSYIADLSTDIEFLVFNWYDPNGNLLDTGIDPTTVTAPFESGNGEYTLDVIINKNGESCPYSYSTFVDIETFLPPTPILSGPAIVCEGDSSVMYTAEGNGEETSFNWSFPNDVASAMISGTMGEVLTIDWSGSAGGEVTVIGQNICGQSNQASIEIQVIMKTTPNFSMDTSVCLDNATTIDFIGTGINIAGYTWDFDGGSILSGSGMGPFELSWDSEGDKSVSLITTDVNGCVSNLTEKIIAVKPPLSPTEVTCVPMVGEVLFTWDIPFGVSGFEVNVLSGQTGGVFSATSFSISDLTEGEEVTIELLTEPIDPICGDFVSTIISCTALDCVPPDIVLSAEQSLCQDEDEITITATITSGETGTGVFSGPGIVDAANGIFDPAQANIGSNTILYSFTSDVAGCTGSKTITIDVFEIPTASFLQSVDTMCITDILDLEYNGTLNPQEIIWDFDGGLGSGLLTDQQVTYDSPGLKTISLQVTKNGCISDIVTSTVLIEPELEDVVIQCDTAGTDFLTFSWNTIVGASLFEIKVDNQASFFSPNTTITIDGLNEEQEVTIVVKSLSVTSCPGSSSSSTCTTTKSPVSVDDHYLSSVLIFPNPVQDILYLEGLSDEIINYEVYSILGSKIRNGKVQAENINISEYQSGIYILRLHDVKEGYYKDFKIIKE